MGTATEYERRKNLVRSIVDDMFNAGNLQVAAEIFAPNFVDRGHETEAGKTDGPAGFAQFVAAVRSALAHGQEDPHERLSFLSLPDRQDCRALEQRHDRSRRPVTFVPVCFVGLVSQR